MPPTVTPAPSFYFCGFTLDVGFPFTILFSMVVRYKLLSIPQLTEGRKGANCPCCQLYHLPPSEAAAERWTPRNDPQDMLQASGQEVPRSLGRAKLALGLSLGPAELVFSTCRLSLAFHLNLPGSLEHGQLIQSHT